MHCQVWQKQRYECRSDGTLNIFTTQAWMWQKLTTVGDYSYSKVGIFVVGYYDIHNQINSSNMALGVKTPKSVNSNMMNLKKYNHIMGGRLSISTLPDN
jgi:hypothetical protein